MRRSKMVSGATGLLLAVALAAGCTDEGGAGRGVVALNDGAAAPVPSSGVRAATGLSHLPAPASAGELRRSLERHYPPRFVAERRTGAVLVDVSVDEQGRVRRVDVVDPPAPVPGEPAHRVVLVRRDPATGRTVETVASPRYDRAFGDAAVAALREVRFTPARRDGRPVPHTARMTVQFQPPAGTASGGEGAG
ncbi:MAG TPA: hypothetical protein VFQ45_18925 [Longimicrobium sp.]|nr:hypothetical protein [Longimicrobium sp.]